MQRGFAFKAQFRAESYNLPNSVSPGNPNTTLDGNSFGQIIDDADTVQEATLEPASVGLDVICRGLRRISADDRTALERGALIYDALCAEIRSEGGDHVERT